MLINDFKEEMRQLRLLRTDPFRVTVLSTLVGECERQYKEATDEQVETVARKNIKNAKIAMDYFYDDKTRLELEILQGYFPDKENVSWEIIAAELDKLMKDNPDKKINDKTVGWFVGQLMKVTKGKADPAAVRDYLLQ